MDAKMNVQVSFSADTKQAKKEIGDLIQSINALSAGTMKTSLMKEISADTKKAAQEVGQFSVMLQRAVNTDTGKLDLTKLNKSLKTANLDLNKVANSFKALGNDGVKAFAGIVNQINAAEVPMKKMNATVDKLWTSLKNTANWTISSSAINALVSGVQNAYRYAQDLDKSLNNIRIVTGYTADKMSRFAVEANKAAKALNTTTQNYTDASLIFYQQGLSDAEVAKRTEVVVKMANVTGETAEKISDQMTAVWNNFADGSKSLEYYADVLTKLGATTASSTDEIVGGLEKFAAVADTIGLSYEYAASALATITSNTRQSEEVVGTALKTIFARIQGLNLGETLDDGTTLNKYSEALQKVGISIFDQAGNLKQMDDILDEMGSKWGTLSDSQQVALAQTVAGVRQYNQLVALMDNWNKSATQGGVSMAENLRTTQNATGELSDQANIYADSWKAAQDRVKASAEQLYDVLIDEEFFKDILNAASGILDFITNLTQGLGGVEGLLSTISAYVLTIARTQISKELIRLTQPSTKKQQKMAMGMKDDANSQLSRITTGNAKKDEQSAENRIVETTYKNIAEVQKKMILNADRLTEEQKALVQSEIEQYKFISDIVAKKGQEVDLAKKELEYAERSAQIMRSHEKKKIENEIDSVIDLDGFQTPGSFTSADIDKINDVRQKTGQSALTDDQVSTLTADPSDFINTKFEGSYLKNYKETIEQIKLELIEARNQQDSFTQSVEQYKEESNKVAKIHANLEYVNLGGENAKTEMTETIKQIKALGGSYEEAANKALEAAGFKGGLGAFNEALEKGELKAEQMSEAAGELMDVLSNVRSQNAIKIGANSTDPKMFSDLSKKIDDAADSAAQFALQEKVAKEEGEKLGKNIDNLNTTTPTWQEGIVAAAGALASFVSAGQALAGMWDTIKDPSIDGWEKITTVFSTLLTVVPSVLMAFKSLSDAKLKDVGINVLNTLSEKLLANAKREGKESSEQLTDEIEDENEAQAKNIALDTVEQVTSKGGKGKIGGKGMPKTKMPAGGTGGAPAAGAGAGAPAGGAGAGGASPTLSAGGASLGASLAIVAVGIAVIAAGIAWAVHQANEAERAVEKAKQAAQELTDNYNTAKAATDEFNSSVSAYQDARSALDDLTKGTEEYSEAVKNANERAMELLDTNENLKYTIENGQIVIDEESIKEQKKVQEENEEKAFAAKIAGQTQLSRAEENLKKRDAARELKSYSDNTEKGKNAAAMGVIGGIGAGLVTGAAAGAIGGAGVFSVPAAIVGAVVGAVAGGVAGVVANTSTDTENDALEKLEKAYLQDETVLQQLEDGTLDFESIGITDPALIESLTVNADEVSDLIEEMGKNTKAIQAQNDLVAANALANNEKVAQSEYQDEIIDIAGDAYGIAYDKALQSDWVDSWGKDGIAKIDGANKEAKNVFAEYLKYAGLEGQGYELVDTTGDDNNRKFVYKDAEGNEQTVSLEAMQAARAAYEASGVMEQTAENLAKTFDRLAMSTNEADHAMLSFLSKKNFEGATKSEFEAFGSGLAGKTPEEVSAQLADYLGVDALTDEVAAQYGYATAGEMVSAMATQAKAAQETWKEIELPKSLSKSISSGMTLDMAQQVEAQVNKINLGPLGKQAGEQYASQLNKMLAGLDTEDQQAALAQLTQIDWSDWDASERMVEIMNSFGVEIDTASSSWVNFVNNMRVATGSTQDLVALKAELIEISKILDGLTIGSSIGEEQYQALIKYKKEWEDFFLMQADGTRRFIGNEKDLQDAIADTIRAGAESSVQHQEYAEAINAELEAAADAAKQAAKESGDNTAIENGEYFSLGISDSQLEKQAGGDGSDGTFYLGKQENGRQDQYAVQALRDMGYYVDTDGKVYTNDAKDEAVTHAEAGRLVIARQRGIWANEHVLDNEAVQEALLSKGYTEEKQKEIIAEAMAGNDERLKKMLDELQEFVTTDYDQLSKEYQEMLASTAGSLEELDKMVQKEGFDPETQTKGLIALASQYENCTEKIKAFKEALQFGTAEEQAVAEQELRIGIIANEIAADTGMDADAVEILIEQYMSEYADATVEEAKTAIQNQIGQRQFALGLSENWEEWNKGLGSNDTIKRAEAMAEIFKSFGDSFGIEDFEVPPEFFEVEENLQLMEEAARGNVDALRQLQTKLKLSYVFKMKQIDVSDEKLAELTTKIQSYLNRIDFKIGISYSFGTEQLEEARKILKLAEEEALANGKTFTEEDANYILSLLGITGKFAHMATDTGPLTTAKGNVYATQFGDGGIPDKFWERLYAVNSIFGEETEGEYDFGDDKTAKDTLSEQQKALEDKKKALLYEEEKALKRIERQLKKNNRLMEQSYGKAKIDAIRDRIKILQEENKVIQDQIDLYNQEIMIDHQNWITKVAGELNDSLKQFGINDITIEFDENGLVNAESILHTLAMEIQKIQLANHDKVLTEEAEKKLSELMSLYNMFISAVNNYDSDFETLKGYEEQFQDNLDEQMSLKYQELEYTLEIKVDLDQSQLRMLDYYINKYSDDFYSMADSLEKMNEKLSVFESLSNSYKEHYDSLQALKGQISQADYIAGLQTARDGIYEQLEALIELDKAMKAYYGETLTAAREELDKSTSHLEHNVGLLQHFKDIMDLMGKSTDYDLMIGYTQDQAAINREQIEISKNWLNILLEQQKGLQEEMAAAAGDDASMEILQQKWDDLVLQIEQAQNDILENTKAWLEKMKEEYDLKMNQISENLEKTLTQAWGFMGEDGQAMWGFDELTKQFNRLSLVQDEFLTKTNQIYETNKLMSQAQQELDKTDNEVSKQKIQNFIKETKGLQDTTKMSQFQLKLQQAKYDLLLAEVALEDARNAKSTVRLKRDSAGNYGYVYTADQDKIAEAEQKVADAENNIYNLSLDAQQEYTQKYMQETQNFFNDLAALNEIREVDEEEYQRRRQALMEQYFGENGILTNLSYLYNQAVEADTDAAADNWMKQHSNMIDNTEDWRDEVNKYIGEIDSAWGEWQTAITTAQGEAKKAIANTDGSTKDLVGDSKKLAQTINNELLGALEDEITAVDNTTDAYARKRQGIKDLIEELQNYTTMIDNTIRAEANMNGVSNGSPTTVVNHQDDYSRSIAQRMIQGHGRDDEYIVEWEKLRNEKLGNMGEEAEKYLTTDQLFDLLESQDDAAKKFVAYVLDENNDAYFTKESYGEFKENNSGLNFDFLKGIFGFKTGGYTGSWGPEGRLAILHQKELVLNAADTQNLLDTVQIVRNTIGDLKRFGEWIPKLITPRTPDVELQPVEKIVQIEASFPGVRDRYEIEEAFNNLINTASQFANRKRI